MYKLIMESIENVLSENNFLKKQNSVFQNILENHPAGIYQVRMTSRAKDMEQWKNTKNVPYTIKYTNNRFLEILQLTKEELFSNPGILLEMISKAYLNSFFKVNNEAINNNTKFIWEGEIIHKGLHEFIHYESEPYVLENGEVLWTGFIYSVKDRIKKEEKLKNKNKKLETLSTTDSLTGVYNKRYFQRRFNLEISYAKRYDSPLSILMIDIDYFKKYNDFYGHLKGDDCLKKIADIINKCLHRQTDTLYRFGGEEFICLLSKTDINGAILIARDIQDNLRRAKIEHEESLISDYLTLSIGVYTQKKFDENITKESILHKADKLLYLAKEKGRNRIRF